MMKKRNRTTSYREIDDITIASLTEQTAFDADRVVVATSDDEQNLLLAEHAKELGVEHVIASVEDPLLQEKQRKNISLYSQQLTLHVFYYVRLLINLVSFA